MTLLSEILQAYPEVDAAGGEALDRVADSAQTLGRKGTVTVKFVVEKQGNSARVVLDIGHEVREPKPDTELHLWHVGPKGLTQDDPFHVRMDPDTGELITPETPRKD